MGQNYFNTLPLRLQLEELGKCRFMDRSEFADGVDAWDCVHPCAFMVRWIKTHTPTSLETLDKYGWLDEYGRPDSEKADR